MVNNDAQHFGKWSRVRRWLIRTAGQFAVAIVLLVTVRITVAQSFVLMSDAVSPEIPNGSRMWVYKLTSTFEPGQIIVFRQDGTAITARVVDTDASSEQLIVGRNAEADLKIDKSTIVGRVFIHTR